MKKETFVVRTIKSHRSERSALLRLFSVNEDGDETLVATSSPVPKVAAMSVCRLLDQQFTIMPSISSLKSVFWIPGRTAWASATAADARSAALQACMQHDIETAQGALVMITLSPDCSIVGSIKAALDVIHRETPLVVARALVVAHDEELSGQRVRVQMMLTGLCP